MVARDIRPCIRGSMKQVVPATGREHDDRCAIATPIKHISLKVEVLMRAELPLKLLC
jgi:hypothetical protein